MTSDECLPERFAAAPEAERYRGMLASDSLAGVRLGILCRGVPPERTTVATLEAFGAVTIELRCPEEFVAAPIRGLTPFLRQEIEGQALFLGLDGVLMFDASGTHVTLVDRNGRIVPGDTLGQIAAQFLQAKTIVAPKYVNSGCRQLGFYTMVFIEAGGAALQRQLEGRGDAVGYEPDGSFYMAVKASDGVASRHERDPLFPILATLSEIKRAGSLEARIALEPKRFTATVNLSLLIAGYEHAFQTAVLARPAMFTAFIRDEIVQLEGSASAPVSCIQFKSGCLVHLYSHDKSLHAVADCSSWEGAEGRLLQFMDAATRFAESVTV